MLSVLIPTFNSQQTIKNCIESVLQQHTDFVVEIIVVDDGSTDLTKQIVSDMFFGNELHTLIVLPENHGKARAIKVAYQVSRGKYIQVLDSDDYLIGTRKFFKQVKFLENNPEYGAVAHNTIIQYPNEEYALVSRETSSQDYSYEQIMKFELYFHTSSIIYRRSLVELPTSFETLNSLRGDSAFMYFHFFVSKLKLHYFPEIMSIYDYHGHGLWSKMSSAEQLAMNFELLRDLQQYVVQDKQSQEYFWLAEKISKLPTTAPEKPKQSSVSLEKLLSHLMDLSAQVYRPDVFARVNSDTFTIALIDSFCEAVGKIVRLSRSQISSTQEKPRKSKSVIILVSGFKQKGGGIFKEIQNLISVHLSLGYHVTLVSTEVVDSEVESWPDVFESPNVCIYKVCEDTFVGKVAFIQDIFVSSNSERLYCLISHHDIVAASSIYPNASQEIVLHFVFDHISTLGLTNSAVDSVITKFESQAMRIRTILPSTKIILIPPFVNSLHRVNPYESRSDLKLNSASGSARAYKFETSDRNLFIHVITSLLSKFNGVHYHFGPIGADFLAEINLELTLKHIALDRFVSLPFSIDFQGDLLDRRIDIFIPPFPIPSVNLTLEVLACGIPLLAQKSEFHMVEISEISGNDQFFWNSKEDLESCLNRINSRCLAQASSFGYSHYRAKHSLDAAIANFKTLPLWEDNKEVEVKSIRDLGSEKIVDLDKFMKLIFQE